MADQARLRDRMERFRSLPPERRQQLRQRFRELSPAERARALQRIRDRRRR